MWEIQSALRSEGKWETLQGAFSRSRPQARAQDASERTAGLRLKLAKSLES